MSRRQARDWILLFTRTVLLYKIIDAEWRMYWSVQHTSIASDIGLSPFRTKPLSEPKLPYCQLDLKEHSLIILFFYLKFKSFIEENIIGNVFCEIVVIWARPHCFNIIVPSRLYNIYRIC